MQRQIDIGICFREAWRGFKLWWIPLCIVASVILFSQSWLPHWLLADSAREFIPFKTAYEEFRSELTDGIKPVTAASQELVDRWAELAAKEETFEAVKGLVMRLLIVTGGLYLPICLLQILMIVLSKAAVFTREKDVRDTQGSRSTILSDMTYGLRALGTDRTVQRDMKRSLLTTVSYGFLTAVKLFAFFYGFLPLLLVFVWEPPLIGILLLLLMTMVLSMLSMLTGMYVYTRLFFTCFLITEQSADPFKAMAASWRMSSGNFFKIFFIFMAAFSIMMVAALTVIGVIPANSFNYTLRAAAYRQLKQAQDTPRT